MKVIIGQYVKYSHMIVNLGITVDSIIETSNILMNVFQY
jgi:hypothetical protein